MGDIDWNHRLNERVMDNIANEHLIFLQRVVAGKHRPDRIIQAFRSHRRNYALKQNTEYAMFDLIEYAMWFDSQ